jgi:hypothetical protein
VFTLLDYLISSSAKSNNKVVNYWSGVEGAFGISLNEFNARLVAFDGFYDHPTNHNRRKL